MKTNPFRMVSLLLVALLIVMLMAPSWADDECRGHSCNDGGDTIVGVDTSTGDTIVGGGDSLGVGFGMGDVDLSNAYGSKSTPVFQWLKELPWGMANDLDAMGAHAAAARVRCQTKTLKKAYPDRKECERAVMFVAPLPPIIVSEEPKKEDEDDSRYEDLYAMVAQLEQQRQQDTANANAAARRANTAARDAEQAEVDRKQYAQQMLDELEEWK